MCACNPKNKIEKITGWVIYFEFHVTKQKSRVGLFIIEFHVPHSNVIIIIVIIIVICYCYCYCYCYKQKMNVNLMIMIIISTIHINTQAVIYFYFFCGNNFILKNKIIKTCLVSSVCILIEVVRNIIITINLF